MDNSLILKKSGKEYENFQTVFSYNSNSIEGNRLELDQVRNLYKGKMPKARETGIHSVDLLNGLKLDNDIAEVKNHFECVDYVIDTINEPLSHNWLFELHSILLKNTQNVGKEWYAVGKYKTVPNYVGNRVTAAPEEVSGLISELMRSVDENDMNLKDIVDFHCRYEHIHPFIDGNGRTGRLLMFRQCLKNNVPLFIVEFASRLRYYKGLSEYPDNLDKMIGYFLELQDKLENMIK